MDEIIWKRLRSAYQKSGLTIKEIAAKSNVSKRTIDRWVGSDAVEPRLIDVVKTLAVVNVPVEEVVLGEEGRNKILSWAEQNGGKWEPPLKYKEIINDLDEFNETELNFISDIIHHQADKAREHKKQTANLA